MHNITAVPQLDQVTIQRCVARVGAAIRVLGGRALVTHSRIEGNSALQAGGAISVEGGEVLLSNQTVLSPPPRDPDLA